MAMVTGAVWGVTGALSVGLPAQQVDPDLADRMPGLGAFIVFAFLAVALYFLLKNMNARLRRMSYREREREALEAAREQERSGMSAQEPETGPGGEPTRPADGAGSSEPESGERG